MQSLEKHILIGITSVFTLLPRLWCLSKISVVSSDATLFYFNTASHLYLSYKYLNQHPDKHAAFRSRVQTCITYHKIQKKEKRI